LGNKFKEKWEAIEKSETLPKRYSGNTITMEFDELKKKVLSQDKKFVESTVESFYSGDAYIIKNAY